MRKFKIDFDDLYDEIFHELESLSNDSYGHEFVINAEDLQQAANDTAALLIPFLKEKLKEIHPNQ